ncbi:hypothetical protein [Shewanella waksmanii]|uniref:F4 family fimbrial subunit n=1 Tax=Shewanella waksmanii TaxID=213783 RepID=UPI0004906A52|nr:hypothetical protein [Shewanella waksmanii]
MKKTMIAGMVSVLMAASANAAFTESADGTFTGSLSFSGSITDTQPAWMWELPEVTINSVTDWNVDKAAGVLEGENAVFDFADKGTFEFLHGYTKSVAAGGQPGFRPIVTVGEGDTAQEINDTVKSISVVASGVGSDGAATADGQLSFSISGGNAVAFFWPESGLWWLAYSGGTAGANARTLLQSNVENYATVYAQIDMEEERAFSWNYNYLNNTSLNASGAFDSTMSDIKLSFPSTSVPATWTADVPVTVTMM